MLHIATSIAVGNIQENGVRSIESEGIVLNEYSIFLNGSRAEYLSTMLVVFIMCLQLFLALRVQCLLAL